jgi:hypothetical protein
MLRNIVYQKLGISKCLERFTPGFKLRGSSVEKKWSIKNIWVGENQVTPQVVLDRKSN